jgi:hypothetical protein
MWTYMTISIKRLAQTLRGGLEGLDYEQEMKDAERDDTPSIATTPGRRRGRQTAADHQLRDEQGWVIIRVGKISWYVFLTLLLIKFTINSYL